ncbi:MAG: trypsin-like peptidase domain-containing protein [Nitrospirae bacterium]|nr:trypsin-like peptidase domain-containing protein [Nitrospirota bacterium]
MRRSSQTAILIALLLLTPPVVFGAPLVLTPRTFVDLVNTQRPVVVGISVILSTETAPRLPQNHPVIPPPPPSSPQTPPSDDASPAPSPSVGTGLLIDTAGLILTNNHVLDQADQVTVTTWGGDRFDATIVGRDPKTDLALVRLKPRPGQPTVFPAARLGDSDAAEVGEWVAAIGNPFGLDQTLTVGILSGKGRALGNSPYEEYLQTDASINPGSSGGPLFNIAGEVIGLTTAINPSGQGIGFAIPINQVKLLLPQLQQGRVRRGWIGVMIQNPSPPAADGRVSGVLITDVMDDSPAAQAGLARGDVIVEFDGAPMAQVRDLPRHVATTAIGKSVTVKLLRKGLPVTATVTVGELKD